jgi:hypothetical protein
MYQVSPVERLDSHGGRTLLPGCSHAAAVLSSPAGARHLPPVVLLPFQPNHRADALIRELRRRLGGREVVDGDNLRCLAGGLQLVVSPLQVVHNVNNACQ